MSGHLVWLAGRGVSMSCGLCWDVPQRLEHAFHRGEIDRAELTAHICRELARAESDPAVDIGPLERMVVRLKRSNGQENSFVTTNWDGLLDRALRAHGFPAPLHLNGSVEERNILTAWDDERARERVPQAREGLRRLLDADVCVVAGLSLANRLDKALIARLRGKRGGRWLVVNDDAEEVRQACELLRAQLASSEVSAVEEPFDAWVEAGMPGLRMAPEGASAEQGTHQ